MLQFTTEGRTIIVELPDGNEYKQTINVDLSTAEPFELVYQLNLFRIFVKCEAIPKEVS